MEGKGGGDTKKQISHKKSTEENWIIRILGCKYSVYNTIISKIKLHIVLI